MYYNMCVNTYAVYLVEFHRGVFVYIYVNCLHIGEYHIRDIDITIF